MKKSKAHILIVDDDDRIRELVKQYLNDYDFLVTTANNAEDAKQKVDIIKFDLIVLDIMMPGQSGLEFTNENKKKIGTPIILLTAKGEATDRIEGLEIGADDYLAKPFEPRELLARIQSILRRSTSPGSMVDKLEFNHLSINKLKQEVLLDNEILHLSTSEYEAILLFAENPGKVMDREIMVESLRGITWQSYDRSVDVLVSRLRNKLGDTTEKIRFIKTIHGIGYKFIATPK